MYPLINFQDFKISVYFLVLAVVYCIGIQYFYKRIKSFSVDKSLAADFLLVLLIFGFIGARLLYVVFQEPEYYLSDWTQILKVWKGGFIFFGGFISSLIAGIIYLLVKRQNLLLWLDLSAPVAALSYGLGRLACFSNGCCYGTKTNGIFGIHFPHLQGLRHPSQMYAVFYELLVWIFLISFERNSKNFKGKGFVFFLWLILHGVGRIIMENYRGDPRGSEIGGYSIGVVISVGIIFLGLLGFLSLKLLRTKSSN